METFEVTRQGPFSPLISAQNIPYLPFSLKSCSKVYLELRRADAGGYGFELGSPDLPYSSLDRVPTQETGQLDYKMGDVLDCKKFLEFWLDWDNGLLRLGKGSVRGENMFLSSQEDPGLMIDQIILNGGTWRLPVQYRGKPSFNNMYIWLAGIVLNSLWSGLQQICFALYHSQKIDPFELK